jgi:hypothetical protein
MTTSRLADTSPRVARSIGIPLFVVAAFLLTSLGGAAIFLAPVTLPLIWLILRAHPTLPFRFVGSTIAGLTVAEVSLIVPYVLFGLGRSEPQSGSQTVSASVTTTASGGSGDPTHETILALAIMAVCAIGTIWAYLWSTQPLSRRATAGGRRDGRAGRPSTGGGP